MRRHRTIIAIVGLCVLIASLVVVAPATVQAETPRRGGVLLAAIAADAPSLDPHQEQTFATIELVAPRSATRRSSATRPVSGRSRPTDSPTRSSYEGGSGFTTAHR